jgi:glycine/D-amino acid oxidase-like deaminating enzyme
MHPLPQPASPKIIVIGAGIIGASIAWHLARRGAAVTIVAGKTGGEATPNSFAWINASWGNPEFYFRLRLRAMAEWKRLAADLPSLPLHWGGGLCFDLPVGQLEAYAVEHSGWGYDIRSVTREQSQAIEPNLTEPPEFALHAAGEGAVEPVAAAKLMLDDAVGLGAALLSEVEVESLIRQGDRIVGINTADGAQMADHVVLAAGVGSVAIAASANIDLPLHAPPGLIVHSRPHAKLLNGLVIAPHLHMRQTTAGSIIAGGDFGGSDPGSSPQSVADGLFAAVKAMLKNAEHLELDTYTIGHRPTPTDGFPIIGGVTEAPGLYLAVMHSGVTLAPLVGLLAANEILSGTADATLAPLRLGRFSAQASGITNPAGRS